MDPRVALVAIFLAADLLYLSFSAPYYRGVAVAVSGDAAGFPRGRIADAVAAYAVLIGGFLAFVPPLARELGARGLSPVAARALAGAGYGAVVYGVFNATNRVMFGGWTLGTALRDTAWGTSLGAAMGGAAYALGAF